MGDPHLERRGIHRPNLRLTDARHPEDDVIDLLTLNAGDAHLTVDLVAGGRISALSIGEAELIVPQAVDPNPLNWGCYPMVPFAGRLQDGLLDFDGATHTLPRTLDPHAIHGYGFTSEWSRLDDQAIEWNFSEPWPFTGRATQRFELIENRLTITMDVLAHQRQPMQVGWHPWFQRTTAAGDLEFELPPSSMYRRGSDGIPDGELITPPPGPWDDCFTALATEPVLRWGDLTLELSADADHWVVYDGPAHAICVEPQTGPPNGVNSAPEILEAGQTLTTSFTMRW